MEVAFPVLVHDEEPLLPGELGEESHVAPVERWWPHAAGDSYRYWRECILREKVAAL